MTESLFYVAFGLIGMLLYGNAFRRRFLGWRRHRDKRSWREVIEAMAFAFVAFQGFALTIGALLEIPHLWLAVGGAVNFGAFVATGFIYDTDGDRDG